MPAWRSWATAAARARIRRATGRRLPGSRSPSAYVCWAFAPRRSCSFGPTTPPSPSPSNPNLSRRPAPQLPQGATASADEKVDLLIERAQQAMLDRHYLDPAEGSALALYRSALLLDPSRGEASQGLQRLAEILFAKVQSALDERKFDVALQALETARRHQSRRQPLGGVRRATCHFTDGTWARADSGSSQRAKISIAPHS